MSFSPRALNTSHPRPLKVLIPLFPDFNTFDANGPIEVLSQANRNSGTETFQLFIAADAKLTKSIEGVSIARDVSLIYALEKVDEWDIVLLPGGVKETILGIIREEGGERSMLMAFLWAYAKVKDGLILTVCTGSLFLAGIGALNGRTATSHWAALGSVKELCEKTKSTTKVVRARWVDSPEPGVDLPRVITAGGVACGIDATFHLVELICGAEVATKVATVMDYQRRGEEVQEDFVIPYVN